MIKDYISLALGNLKHRGIRSWLTMLGIFIGIAAVVALISLGQGLQAAVTGQFATLSPNKLIVQNAETGFGPPGSTAVKKLNDQDVNIISKISNVKLVTPRFIRVVKVEYNDIARFIYVTNVPEEQDNMKEMYLSTNMKSDLGRLLQVGDRGKVILGSDFLDNDQFDKKIRLGSSITIQGKDFEVVGILQKTGTFTVNSAIFLMEDDLKDILNLKDEYDLLSVTVTDKNLVSQVSNEISRKLRNDRGEKEGEEDFSVQTPVQSVQSINTILNMINLIVIGIAAISLIIGGIGIINTMYTSVLERTKEIGVMKAVGAKNSDILQLFMIESGLLGLVGGIVGAIIGLAFAFGVSGLMKSVFPAIDLQIQLSWPLLILAVVFSLLIGLLSGVLPAIQASRLRPTEALRG